MDLVQASGPIKNLKRRERHVEYFRSNTWRTVLENGSECPWVVCRFSPHSDTVLYLGDDEGFIGVMDIGSVVDSETDVRTNVSQYFAAHSATIMDLVGVPHRPDRLLSISGDTTVRLWDLERQESTLFYGHEMSVRSACFVPESSNVFATGGRDGQIRLWDARTSCFRQQGQVVKKPVNVYKGAHVIKDYRTPPKKKSSAARKSSRFDSAEPPSVTSLVYANEHTLVSGSSHGKSGLRLWDTRKISVKDEGHVLATLEVPTHKDAGITSLCLDRYGSSLFAAVTDSCVYEYGITTSCSKPLRHFTGAAIESFYVQVQCSPAGDYLLCGSKNQQAIMWDLRDLYSYSDPKASSAERQCRAVFPKYTLKGHNSEVCCVGWSKSGRYIVSMDDELFRVWNADNLNPTVAQESGSKSEFISSYELNESEKAVVMMKRVLIKKDRATHISTSAGTGTPTRKRKEPFTSPLKRLNTPTKSPTSKIMKLASPVLPLSNITNVDNGVSTPCSVSRRRKRGAFYYRYPTENLPNKVYERFVAKFKAKRLAEKREASGVDVASNPPSTCKKNISDYCTKSVVEQVNSSSKLGRSRLPSINDFGDSVCSKMLSEQDRAVQNSPRKLTVKLTPLKAQPLDRIKEQNCNSQRRSSRNLLDYFSKK
ncbi:hypothetical protein Q1695_002292 [Nippostrongylus brasiliensis]|nr:hypothetical protein Q1695_002292 [Nippostrongylus brasiliensis]